MAQFISNLQITEPKSWAGLTTDNHLHTIFAQEPTLMSTVMSRVFGQYKYAGLDYFMSIGMDQEVPTDNDFEWWLKGDDERALPVVGFKVAGVLNDLTAKPGVNKTIFTILFAEKLFFHTEVLVADDPNYRVRVMSEPYADGVNWAYDVQIMTADNSKFVPVTLLAAGRQFSKDYAPQERTLSKTGGGTNFTSPFKMRNAMSTIRKKYVIPGNMHQRPLVIEMTDPASGKTTKIWTQYEEWVMLAQWYMEKDRNLLYSESNKNNNGTYDMMGDSGFPIIEGAGLRAQISPSYQFYYNTFSIDYLEDVLLNMSINTLKEDQRHFVACTGERGFVQFHKALENYAARFQPLDSKRITGSGQNLGVQGQYREFMGPQGIGFTLVHCPAYDDKIRNRIPHPDGGQTESYRYTIMNVGTTEGKKNITRVYPAGRKELMWHVPGSTSPLGPMTSFRSQSASSVDGYELYCMANQGVMINNPMSCAELISSVTL